MTAQNKVIPNYNRSRAIQAFDNMIEQFGVLSGIRIASGRMQRIPVDRCDIPDSILDELIRRSDEFEEMLKAAGILKERHGIGAFRWDDKYIYVYVYHAAPASKSRREWEAGRRERRREHDDL